jgi:hypothetical protein
MEGAEWAAEQTRLSDNRPDRMEVRWAKAEVGQGRVGPAVGLRTGKEK